MSAPVYVVRYEDRDITRSIAPYVVSLSYADKEHGGAAELTLTVEDSDGRWRDAWWPEHGDGLEAWIGYDDSPLLPCGRYEVDEIEASAPPDTVQIKALAAGRAAPLRTARNRAFEGQSLREVAAAVAEDLGLTLEGRVPSIRLGRVTQLAESDLAMLRRLATAYGCAFAVRGERLVFHELADLEAGPGVAKLSRADIAGYSLRAPTQGRASAVRVSHFSPIAGELLWSSEQDASYPFEEMSLVQERVEDHAQAHAQARARVAASRRRRMTGSITLAGAPRLVAGVTLDLAEDMGKWAGRYHVTESTHSVERGTGYTTELKVHGL